LAKIGEEGINPEEMGVDSQSIQGIKWLWGPSLFKILVWKE
jgi:hypothetical protein